MAIKHPIVLEIFDRNFSIYLQQLYSLAQSVHQSVDDEQKDIVNLVPNVPNNSCQNSAVKRGSLSDVIDFGNP